MEDTDDSSRSSNSSSSSSSSSSSDDSSSTADFLSDMYDFDDEHLNDFLLDLGISDELFGGDDEEESYCSDSSDEEEQEDMRGKGPRKKARKRFPYDSPFYKYYIKHADEHAHDDEDSVWGESSDIAKSFTTTQF